MTQQLPIRRTQFQTAAFLAYLAENGCEIGKPSNAYEVVRYRAYHAGSARPITHIVYAKETGLLTWMPGTQGHYHSFLAGAAITGNAAPIASKFDCPEPAQTEPIATAPSKPGRKKKRKRSQRARLIERDGTDCWFCGEALGDDITIEHLVPKSKGGSGSLANFALAHLRCNNHAADLPLVDKIALRERLRAMVPA